MVISKNADKIKKRVLVILNNPIEILKKTSGNTIINTINYCFY